MCRRLWSTHCITTHVHWCHCWQRLLYCHTPSGHSMNVFYSSVFKLANDKRVVCAAEGWLHCAQVLVYEKKMHWKTCPHTHHTCVMHVLNGKTWFCYSFLPQSCFRFFLLFIVLCFFFAVWSLFSLMLSCVVHRWKKRIFYRAFM